MARRILRVCDRLGGDFAAGVLVACTGPAIGVATGERGGAIVHRRESAEGGFRRIERTALSQNTRVLDDRILPWMFGCQLLRPQHMDSQLSHQGPRIAIHHYESFGGRRVLNSGAAGAMD